MNPNLTEIAIVLDRSGSMEFIRTATIEGVNEFLKTQRQLPGEVVASIHLFDDQHEWPARRMPLKSVMDLTRDTFVPRGMTALYDAICQTIDYIGGQLAITTESARPSKVIVVIVTDGMENASKHHTQGDVASRIRVQRETYNWEFVFLGSNQDAILSAKNLGISQNSAMTYRNENVDVAFASAAAYTTRARAGQATAFTQEERDASIGVGQ